MFGGGSSTLDGDVAKEDPDGAALCHSSAAIAEPIAPPAPVTIDAFLQRLSADVAPVAGFVNCAAVFNEEPFEHIGWDSWKRTLFTNLIGPYRLTVGCARAMRPGSSIVNITSVEAFHVLSTGRLSSAHYAASKGALQTLTQSLAVDLAPHGIRVNAVAPGFVDTAINPAMRGDAKRRRLIEAQVPLGERFASPAEVAGPVCFLLSDDARYVTGQTVTVDGGLTLGTIRPGPSADPPLRGPGRRAGTTDN